jgi:carbon starvation protein
LQYALGTVYTPLKNISWIPGTIFCSAFVTLFWGYLLYGGSVSTIWPIFGTTNQLLGTVALAIGTSVILRRTKNKLYGLITAIPMSFLGVTTLTAGIMALRNTYIPQGLYLNASLLILAMVLVVIIVIDAARSWIKALDPGTAIYVDNPSL